MCAASGVIPAGRSLSPSEPNPVMSAPAENARSPAPRRTTTRASARSSSSDQRCSMTAAETALTCGLSRQIVLITRPPVTTGAHFRRVPEPSTGTRPKTARLAWAGDQRTRGFADPWPKRTCPGTRYRDRPQDMAGTAMSCAAPTPSRGLGRLRHEAFAKRRLPELADGSLRDLVDELE